MGMFSSIANFASGLAGGIADTALNFAGQKKLQNMSIDQQNRMFEQQKAWEEEKAKNSWQWTMEDLKNSGLNPTLMMGGSTGATVAGSSAPGAVGVPGFSGNTLSNTMSALKLSKELGIMDATKENIDADTNLKGAQSGKTEAETEFQKTQNKYQDQILNLEIALKSETNREIRAKIEKTLNETAKIQKEIDKTENEIFYLKQQGKIAEAEALTKTNNRRAYAILEMTESATRSVGNVMGAVKGTSAMPTTGNFNSNSVNWIKH